MTVPIGRHLIHFRLAMSWAVSVKLKLWVSKSLCRLQESNDESAMVETPAVICVMMSIACLKEVLPPVVGYRGIRFGLID
jgi:hypothetical protein